MDMKDHDIWLANTHKDHGSGLGSEKERQAHPRSKIFVRGSRSGGTIRPLVHIIVIAPPLTITPVVFRPLQAKPPLVAPLLDPFPPPARDGDGRALEQPRRAPLDPTALRTVIPLPVPLLLPAYPPPNAVAVYLSLEDVDVAPRGHDQLDLRDLSLRRAPIAAAGGEGRRRRAPGDDDGRGPPMNLRGNAQAGMGAYHPVHAERDVPPVVTFLGHHDVADRRREVQRRAEVRFHGEVASSQLGGGDATAPAALFTYAVGESSIVVLVDQ